MVIVIINFVILFFIFCIIFIKTWADATRGYLYGIEKKVNFTIKKKYIIIFIIFLLNWLISLIIYYIYIFVFN
jgi:hypothetical protein